MQYLSFCAWLLSLSLMSFKFIYVVTNGRIFFFRIFLSIKFCHCKQRQFYLFLSSLDAFCFSWRMLLGRKLMTNLDSILKSRDTTLPTKVSIRVKAMVFSSDHVWMWELDCEESWAPKNWCFWTVVLEKTVERVPWTARRSNQSILKRSVLGVHWNDWCWSWNSNTLATLWEKLTHLKRCRQRLKVWGERDNREWDCWMASPIQWTWIWVNSGSWWWTGRPGVLRFMGSQRVGHDWTELNWGKQTLEGHKQNLVPTRT